MKRMTKIIILLLFMLGVSLDLSPNTEAGNLFSTSTQSESVSDTDESTEDSAEDTDEAPTNDDIVNNEEPIEQEEIGLNGFVIGMAVVSGLAKVL